LGKKIGKKNRVISITLPRLRLLQKSDFARILDYDYFRNLISLEYSITITSENYVALGSSITITSENYVALDSSITITSENYVALDYSITITSKKSSQPIWPSLHQDIKTLFKSKARGLPLDLRFR